MGRSKRKRVKNWYCGGYSARHLAITGQCLDQLVRLVNGDWTEITHMISRVPDQNGVSQAWYLVILILIMKMMMITTTTITINLIYIAQYDTNGILTALYVVIQYIQMQYVPI